MTFPWIRVSILVLIVISFLFSGAFRTRSRKRKYTRGRQLGRGAKNGGSFERPWGTHGVSKRSSRQHFLVAGTSGSGKSLIQRRLMKNVLCGIKESANKRALIFDADNNIVPYLKQIGVTCPVYSLNPMESRTEYPKAVYWEMNKDVTSSARALNVAYKIIPEGDGGNNRFFSDAARILVWGILEAFMRHSPNAWTLSDVVYVSLSWDRVTELLSRDENGREHLSGVLRAADKEGVTADNVFSTMYTKMAFYRPVAALWQRATEGISIREWLKSDSILLFGADATVKESLNLMNELMFGTFVEEVMVQPISSKAETILWLDELRLCKPVLNEKLTHFVLQARKHGGILLGGFQDIEGLRKEAGKELANEIIAQCSHKALLRMESRESAKWASELVGEFETIEHFETSQGNIARKKQSVSEQRVLKDNVLPSEFYAIPEPTPETGVKGYFISPGRNPYGQMVPASEFRDVVVSEKKEEKHGIVRRKDSDQELIRRTGNPNADTKLPGEPVKVEPPKKQLKLKIKSKRDDFQSTVTSEDEKSCVPRNETHVMRQG